MRRFGIAVLVPLLLAACASQPPQTAGHDHVSGKYAIVLDPELDRRQSVHGVQLLHYSVRAALQQRLKLADSPATADAVILLKPGTTPDRLQYDILRGGRTISRSARIPMIVPGSERSIGEQLEAQRNREYARGDHNIKITRRDPTTYRPSAPRVSHESAQIEAVFRAGNLIADEIVRDLAKP